MAFHDTKMKTIGIAGVTIPGAVDCIHKIHRLSSSYFPEHVHPSIVMVQPNFLPTQKALQDIDWKSVRKELIKSIELLARAKADFVIIPANTVHKVIDELQEKSSIPVLNMLQIVAEECQRQNKKKIGVMGTSWTMAGHLYRDVLQAQGIEECIPSENDQKVIQDAIFKELILTGKASPATLSALLQIVEMLKAQGCDGICLGCTELPLVLNSANCALSVIDSTHVLAEAAIKAAIKV